MKTKIILQNIEKAETKICQAENNLQYIKALKSCFFWLSCLASAPGAMDTAEYLAYFCTGAGFSFYDRVQNSILDYNYGNKPF